MCEPYYRSVRVLVLTSCLFYFPTTMLLMFCYGTMFHSQKLRMNNRRALCTALPLLLGRAAATSPRPLTEQEELEVGPIIKDAGAQCLVQ